MDGLEREGSKRTNLKKGRHKKIKEYGFRQNKQIAKEILGRKE